MLGTTSTLFGTENRSRVLIALRLLEQSWASELSALLGLRLFVVQTALRSLELEGALVSQLVGRSRVFSLNPRYVAARELSELLWKLGSLDVDLQQQLAERRRRPRRSGKEL